MIAIPSVGGNADHVITNRWICLGMISICVDIIYFTYKLVIELS